MIDDLAGKPNLEPAKALVEKVIPRWKADHSVAVSFLFAEISHSPDSYLESFKRELELLQFHSAYDVIENLRPKGQIPVARQSGGYSRSPNSTSCAGACQRIRTSTAKNPL